MALPKALQVHLQSGDSRMSQNIAAKTRRYCSIFLSFSHIFFYVSVQQLWNLKMSLKLERVLGSRCCYYYPREDVKWRGVHWVMATDSYSWWRLGETSADSLNHLLAKAQHRFVFCIKNVFSRTDSEAKLQMIQNRYVWRKQREQRSFELRLLYVWASGREWDKEKCYQN